MNSRRNSTADMDRHHAAGHSTVSSLTTYIFFVLFHNISNYITTNNQIVDIIMPSLPTTHHAIFFSFHVYNNKHVFLECQNLYIQSADSFLRNNHSLNWWRNTVNSKAHYRFRRVRYWTLSWADEFNLNFHGFTGTSLMQIVASSWSQ